jgi:hypothetical protein
MEMKAVWTQIGFAVATPYPLKPTPAISVTMIGREASGTTRLNGKRRDADPYMLGNRRSGTELI